MKTDQGGMRAKKPAPKRPQVVNVEFWELLVWKLQGWEAERTNAAD
jgi:hypothetical protein